MTFTGGIQARRGIGLCQVQQHLAPAQFDPREVATEHAFSKQSHKRSEPGGLAHHAIRSTQRIGGPLHRGIRHIRAALPLETLAIRGESYRPREMRRAGLLNPWTLTALERASESA
ncbi:MAG: hypothetical protein ACKVVP_08490 [Chloroflexota bacterium]